MPRLTNCRGTDGRLPCPHLELAHATLPPCHPATLPPCHPATLPSPCARGARCPVRTARVTHAARAARRWLKDAANGKVYAAKRYRPADSPILFASLPLGTTVVRDSARHTGR